MPQPGAPYHYQSTASSSPTLPPLPYSPQQQHRRYPRRQHQRHTHPHPQYQHQQQRPEHYQHHHHHHHHAPHRPPSSYAPPSPAASSSFSASRPPPLPAQAPGEQFVLLPPHHEPNCSVCNRPAKLLCDCEFRSLVVAVEDSELRVMGPLWDDLREWVTTKAQQAVHARFDELANSRRAQLTDYIAHSAAAGGPAAATMATDYARGELQHNLQRAIDADWRSCTQLFPAFLDQYYAIAERAIRRGPGLDGLILGRDERLAPPLRPPTSSPAALSVPLRRSGGGGGGAGGGRPHDEWWFVSR